MDERSVNDGKTSQDVGTFRGLAISFSPMFNQYRSSRSRRRVVCAKLVRTCAFSTMEGGEGVVVVSIAEEVALRPWEDRSSR